MTERKAVLLKKDFIKAERLCKYTDVELGKVFRSFLLNINGIDDEINDRELAEKVCELLDYDNEFGEVPYQKQVERNRENGKKGGRPKKATETQDNPENPVGLEKTQKSQINKNKEKEIDSINIYTSNDLLRAKIQEFLDYRRHIIKKPVKSIDNMLKMLNRVADTDEQKIQVITRSIENEWVGLFALDNKGNDKAKIIEHDYESVNIADPRKRYRII